MHSQARAVVLPGTQSTGQELRKINKGGKKRGKKPPESLKLVPVMEKRMILDVQGSAQRMFNAGIMVGLHSGQ